jgi:hypothetical protein
MLQRPAAQEDVAAGKGADDGFKRALPGFGGADAVARLQALGLPGGLLAGLPAASAQEQLALAAAAAGHRPDGAAEARLHGLPGGVPLMR